MPTLVGELSNCYDYFFRLLEFPDLFGKVFLITSELFQLDFQTILTKAMEIKQFLIN